MGSVLLSSKTPTLRRDSSNPTVPPPPPPPPLPPRRHSLANPPPLQLKSVTLSGGMESRYYNRPSSPRGSRLVNPARSSTGTFADPYYDSSHYARPNSPRSNADRAPASHHQSYTYAPSSSSGSRTANVKYDSYSGRPRRNTLNESDDRLVRPNVNTLAPAAAHSLRTQAHAHYDRPSSPLARSWDTRGDTYITHGPSRREHKRIYSVDDNSHSAKLIAEKEIVEPRRREGGESRGYSVTSGGRSYHQNQSLIRNNEVGDDGYSYTDPAGMYRDTEPAWRRPRSGSVERGSRPTSLIMERGPRTSNRELGPPPTTRGFDKINNGIGRNSSVHDLPIRSPIERSREIPKYEPYPDAVPVRSSSTRHHAPTVHQEPRRDTYHNEYDRRDRDLENRRYNTADRFEDREVASRGFGIAPGTSSVAQDHHALDRQPIWNAQEVGRPRPEEYGAPYYTTDRTDARMPEPRIPREREVAPTYEERPRERESRRDSRDFAPAAAGVAAGAAATYGAAELLKSRDRDRDRDRNRERDRDREREVELERERRREWDERDRRDKVPSDRRERKPEERRDDRRDRGPEERRERFQDERVPPASLPPATAAYASTQDLERKIRERRYEDEERDRRSRKVPSPEGSGDERPRHYVERDVARESDRRKDTAPKEVALDPDEEYRRRIQQEAERSGRATRDRDYSDSDREKDRRRRKEERDRSRGPPDEASSRGPPTNVMEPPHPRYNERSSSVLDTNIVHEPESLTTPASDQPNKSVQIVEPPKEQPAAPKGILRKPTEKFPEDPEPIREGVAPHKSAMKGKDIPPGARWTRIDRRLVNPEALEEAKERFEERMDCVIVLRVLTKQDIQKLADRTKEIREAREDEYERREHRDRDRRSHRSHRDDEDRDRDRGYDYETDDDDIRRDERERDRPRMIESGR